MEWEVTREPGAVWSWQSARLEECEGMGEPRLGGSVPHGGDLLQELKGALLHRPHRNRLLH